MIAFIDDHHEAYGVEPICRVLPIAPFNRRGRPLVSHQVIVQLIAATTTKAEWLTASIGSLVSSHGFEVGRRGSGQRREIIDAAVGMASDDAGDDGGLRKLIARLRKASPPPLLPGAD